MGAAYITAMLSFHLISPLPRLVGASFSTASRVSKMSSVGIVGGGFAGLGVAFQMCQVAKEVHIYDHYPAGAAKASSAAGGLFHPFAPRGNFIWKGREGFQAASEVLDKLRTAQLYKENDGFVRYGKHYPILRPLYADDDNKSWLKTCKLHPELAKELPRSHYMSAIGMTERHEPANNIVGCIALTESATVHAPRYLQSLWKYVELHSAKAQWHTSVCSPEDIHEKMAHHDVVIVAGGFASTAFFSIEPKVKFVRGRNLHYRPKQPHPEVASSMSAPSPVLSGEYIVPRYEPLQETAASFELIAGATHEHIPAPDKASVLNNLVQPLDDDINESIAAARPLLEDRLVKLYPHLHGAYQAYRVSSGIRLVTERTNLGRLPIVGKLSDRVWVLTGLGSRGLVYHALMAQYLTQAIISNDESLIPQPLQPQAHYPHVRS